MALPVKFRLKKKQDFDKTFRQGRAVKNSSLLLRYRSNNLSLSRFGFVVSVKIAPTAVLRNRMRRVLSQFTQEKLTRINSGYDIVITALHKPEKENYTQLREALGKILQDAGLLR